MASTKRRTGAKQRVGQVVRYAIATGRAERDPTADLRGALAPITVTNRALITDPREVAQLLRALHGYRGHPVVEAALKTGAAGIRAPWASFALRNGLRSIWTRLNGGSPHTA